VHLVLRQVLGLDRLEGASADMQRHMGLALEHKATFWTQDADYQDLPGVQYFLKSTTPSA
jgi:hypothetical protein